MCFFMVASLHVPMLSVVTICREDNNEHPEKILSNIVEFDAENAVRCAICSSSLLLSESVVDEKRQPVHSECNVNKLSDIQSGRCLAFSNPSDYFPAR
jgi:hypothetical protein